MIESAQRYDIKGKAYIETVGVVMVAEKDKAGKVMRKHLEVDFVCNLVAAHYDEHGILTLNIYDFLLNPASMEGRLVLSGYRSWTIAR